MHCASPVIRYICLFLSLSLFSCTKRCKSSHCNVCAFTWQTDNLATLWCEWSNELIYGCTMTMCFYMLIHIWCVHRKSCIYIYIYVCCVVIAEQLQLDIGCMTNCFRNDTSTNVFKTNMKMVWCYWVGWKMGGRSIWTLSHVWTGCMYKANVYIYNYVSI